jgi:hypothetical protein
MPLKPDAIPTDAPAADTQGSLPDLNDPNASLSRADAMAVMRARRRESFVAEMDPEEAKAFLASAPPITAAEPDPDADPDDAVAEATRKQLEAQSSEPAPIDAGEQLEAQRAENLILSDEDLSKYMVRVKINGKEELRPLTEVRATAQKTESADRYLADAKALLAEVKAAQSAQPAASATTPIEPEQTNDGTDAIDAAIDSLFQGDEATAKAKFRQAVMGRVQATPNALPDQLARQVEQRLVLRSALRQFAKDHKDITADPMARRVADTFLLEETGGVPIEQIDPDRIPEVLEEAGRKTKDWLRTMAGITPTQARATTRDEKRALKAGIDELPAASTRAASTVPAPKSVSERIAEMAAARGQMVQRP